MRHFLPNNLMLENYYTFLLMYPKILSKIKFVNFRDIIIVILVICVWIMRGGHPIFLLSKKK